jgi:hypothetical protein
MQVESVLHQVFDRRGQVTKARCRTFLNAVLTPEPPPALKGPAMTHSKFATHNARCTRNHRALPLDRGYRPAIGLEKRSKFVMRANVAMKNQKSMSPMINVLTNDIVFFGFPGYL